MTTTNSAQIALCIRRSEDDDLELRKAYPVLPAAPNEVGFLRVVDESGDDYLYPSDYFIIVEVSRTVEEALLKAPDLHSTQRRIQMDTREWYSAKCIFEHDGLAEGADETVYEERVVLLRADNIDEALDLGEAEARKYADSIRNDSICYIGFISAYRTNETEVTDKMEVYAMMRQTKLSREEFMTRYYADGSECTQH